MPAPRPGQLEPNVRFYTFRANPSNTLRGSVRMIADIDVTALGRLDVAADGSCIRMGYIDTSGREVVLNVPTECLSALVLSLPHVADKALRLRHDDDSLRIVYPASMALVERSSDPDVYIVTLGTPDAFHVSFGLTAPQCRSIARRVEHAAQSGEHVTRLM
jgi:hypothetical protein